MIRVFPRRTKWTPDDELAFVGDPPLFRPEDDEVFVSCLFTWDIPEAERLRKAWMQFYTTVWLYGPAFGSRGNEFKPGVFVKKGVTITSRGCCWKCPWCFVHKREGNIRELPIMEGWIIQDNNLLACTRTHVQAVFDMLSMQKEPIKFSGGLDGRFLRQWHIDQLKKLKIKELWFACDDNEGLRSLESVAELTSDFPISKKRCYVMIGFNHETLLEAENRLERVYQMGFLPFSQLYQPRERINYSKEWRNLNRKWSRPAAYRTKRIT